MIMWGLCTGVYGKRKSLLCRLGLWREQRACPLPLLGCWWSVFEAPATLPRQDPEESSSTQGKHSQGKEGEPAALWDDGL